MPQSIMPESVRKTQAAAIQRLCCLNWPLYGLPHEDRAGGWASLLETAGVNVFMRASIARLEPQSAEFRLDRCAGTYSSIRFTRPVCMS